jgi:outer membrane autotransporter protein
MKGMLKGVAALALATMFAASSAQAQAKFGVAGTGLFSLESGGGSAFGGMALVGFQKAESPIGFRVDGTVTLKGTTQIIGTADITYAFKTAASSMFHPYLLAGGGVTHVPDLTKPMAKAGVGADYNMRSNLTIFGEATFDMFFYGGLAGTQKALQANLGVKFGG